MPQIIMQAGSTSLILNGAALDDLAEGDFIELNFPNAVTSHINGSNNSVTINRRNDASVMDLTVRFQKFSASDAILNSAVNQATPVVFNGSIKEDFTRDGTRSVESYILENGTITTRGSNVKNNTDGNGMIEYVIRFRNASRNI